jgi:F-type H+-transporting ATPase subunit a
VTSSALALGSVLAAEGGGGDGFQAPGLGEFYPEPLVTFSVVGIPF